MPRRDRSTVWETTRRDLTTILSRPSSSSLRTFENVLVAATPDHIRSGKIKLGLGKRLAIKRR
jgi:hypothetical protein